MKSYHYKKGWVYLAAFLAQTVVLALPAIVPPESTRQLSPWGGLFLLWGLPSFLLAVVFYTVYKRARLRTMWSYLGLQTASVFVYYLLSSLYSAVVNADNPFYRWEWGYMLDLLLIGLLLILALLPVLPVCLFYSAMCGRKADEGESSLQQLEEIAACNDLTEKGGETNAEQPGL